MTGVLKLNVYDAADKAKKVMTTNRTHVLPGTGAGVIRTGAGVGAAEAWCARQHFQDRRKAAGNGAVWHGEQSCHIREVTLSYSANECAVLVHEHNTGFGQMTMLTI